jgi:NAD(P)-dependent dehydrogenase (short-subunit alcohol dehydrogenase family)
MAAGLARAGATVGVLGRRRAQAEEVAEAIGARGGAAFALTADVTDTDQLAAARQTVLDRYGRLDILVNAAGGNMPAATLSEGRTVFDLPLDALRQVLDLNLLGTVLASQVFGQAMVQRTDGTPPAGSIVNISSMSSTRVITRVLGYSAAKAAVENVTRWMAVELARAFGPGLRVNALAPGFFIGEQNRALLLQPDGTLTARGHAIIQHTPAGRFGEPEELVGTLIWLCSPSAAFVNGTVVPVDGGFSIFSGV